ncbi:LAETG motif-containing sortase-dependent surface protein [Streptomyces rutgersensis]|uniref:LAETG motif-containing sortase-dependent surface protein n=1 Tax=Streptomyces diastaticus group TaxID=2849069 RepID=UPI003908ABDA
MAPRRSTTGTRSTSRTWRAVTARSSRTAVRAADRGGRGEVRRRPRGPRRGHRPGEGGERRARRGPRGRRRGNAPEAKGAAGTAVEEKPAGGEDLAETGGDSATPYVAIGGAGVLALGAAFLFASARRRAVGSRH